MYALIVDRKTLYKSGDSIMYYDDYYGSWFEAVIDHIFKESFYIIYSPSQGCRNGTPVSIHSANLAGV